MACLDQTQEGYSMALRKDELIGELKHEINSPLAAIRNALYLAAARARDPEVRREALRLESAAAVAERLHAAVFAHHERVFDPNADRALGEIQSRLDRDDVADFDHVVVRR